MSTEHDILRVDPRLDRLLRQIATADDLRSEQDRRVRARLGLPAPTDASASLIATPLPATRRESTLIPNLEQEVPVIATTPARGSRQQWLQFAFAAIAFILIGVLLALVFQNGDDRSDSRPGTSASPVTTATTEPIDAARSVQRALAELPSNQERRMVLDVEAHTDHDNAFDRWTVELWERWSADGILDQGLFVTGPSGEGDVHIVLDGQQSLMNWEPRDGTFDVPLEYALQRRVLSATLAAVNDPDTYNLRGEDRDGQVVVHFEWRDDTESEFGYLSRGEVWIDPESDAIQRVVHLIDRPDQEPYPTRTFTVRDVEVLPAGSSPAGTYDISRAVAPDEMGMYRDITLEQAQAIVPFEIVVPAQAPDGLEPPGITVVESPPLATGGRSYRVEMWFELSGDESPRKSVQFLQFTSGSSDPDLPGSERSTITVNGTTVTRTLRSRESGTPLLSYWWERAGITNQVLAAPEGDLTPALVEQLVIAIPSPDVSTTEDQESVTVPHIDGAVEIETSLLASEHLPFTASDAVGTLHVAEGQPMAVISYYNHPDQTLREAGWEGSGFQSQQYVAYSGWANGDRVVIFTVIPGRARELYADEMNTLNLGPFAFALDQLGENENLIYTREAVCEEPQVEDCLRTAAEDVFVTVTQP